MDDAQTDAPLPCPFCGRIPTLEMWKGDWGQDRPMVTCDEPDCPVDGSFFDLERWNRRSALASPRAIGSVEPSPLGDEDTLRKVFEHPEARGGDWCVRQILALGFKRPSTGDRRIGQPEGMWMDEYGSLLVGVFGYCVYHVGSSMNRQRGWSDVDIRVILTDEQYAAWGLGKPEDDHRTPRWLGLCKAFSEIGKRITGLPIDFQIQQQTAANKEYGDKPRSALFKHDGSTIASDDLPSPSLASDSAPAFKRILELEAERRSVADVP